MLRNQCDFRGPDADIPTVCAPTQIWTYCLDSHNAIRTGPCSNPTNDTVLQVVMTADRQIFNSMELVTAEIPMPDHLECTFRVQRDLILPLCEEDRVLRNVEGFELVLPCTWNRVDYEGDGVFRTEVSHQLKHTPGNMWLWGGCEPFPLVHYGKICHDVCVLGDHTFRVQGAHSHTHALYVYSTPLTFEQVAAWAGVPFDRTSTRLPGYTGTRLYQRLTSCELTELLCVVPCVLRRSPTSNLVEQLQTSSDVCYLAHKAQITITDYCGHVISSLKLPKGYFNPQALCIELSKDHIDASINCGRLCIRSRDKEMFRVSFKGQSADGTYFGFAFSELEGLSHYEADKAECWWLPRLKWTQIDCNKVAVKRLPVAGQGTVHEDCIKFEDAHGFREDDAVMVKVGEETYLTRVVHASLHCIEIDRPHGWGHAQDQACAVESFPPPLYLFGARGDPILGFLEPSDSGAWVSTQPTDLRGETYVLMQIVDPMGSAQCEQASARGTVSGIIGKCVFMSLFRVLNEHAPRIFKFFPSRRVTEIHVRLLNPDGSLYQMRGMHWSATLLFRT
jgi:hypothetical protein